MSENNPKPSKKQINKNELFLKESKLRLYDIFRTRKFWKLEARKIVGDPDHYYDDREEEHHERPHVDDDDLSFDDEC